MLTGCCCCRHTTLKTNGRHLKMQPWLDCQQDNKLPSMTYGTPFYPNSCCLDWKPRREVRLTDLLVVAEVGRGSRRQRLQDRERRRRWRHCSGGGVTLTPRVPTVHLQPRPGWKVRKLFNKKPKNQAGCCGANGKSDTHPHRALSCCLF